MSKNGRVTGMYGGIIMLGLIWVGMILISVLFSCANGTGEALSAALFDGAGAAVTLCIEIGGIICLWCAVLEVMRDCGILTALSRILSPILRLLFPESAEREEIMQPLSANVSANLLGLGNAATPMGIRAAQGMARLGGGDTASDELCKLVVLNTASIQLLPTTIAAIRAANGAAQPFDILPEVWLSSAVSVAVGLIAARLMSGRSKA